MSADQESRLARIEATAGFLRARLSAVTKLVEMLAAMDFVQDPRGLAEIYTARHFKALAKAREELGDNDDLTAASEEFVSMIERVATEAEELRQAMED